MSRAYNTKINIIIDGNSIPLAYGPNLVTQLDALYGAGNYNFSNISVAGQTIDNGGASCMQGRINQFCKNSMRGFASKNILIFQEIRNEMFVNGSTPAQAVAKAVTYCNTVRAALPSTCTIKIGIITPIADDDTGANITTARSLILADTSGAWDFVIDLYSHNNGGTGSFSNSLNTNTWYNGAGYDGTHPNATGNVAAGSFVGSAIHTLYP